MGCWKKERALLWQVFEPEIVVMTELIENDFLVGGGVLQQWYSIRPAGHPSEFSTEIAAIFTALVLVQQKSVLLELV